MYIPKNQYRKKQTYGDEFTKPDGTDYVGPYIETAKGLTLAGKTLDKNAPRLTPKPKVDLNNIERPYNDYYSPTDKDYLRGIVTRYFIRDRRGKFTEMSRKQWQEKRNGKRVTAGQLNWTLKGPVADGKYNGVPFKGASTKNREALQRPEKDYPGISEFFKSTSEFVR